MTTAAPHRTREQQLAALRLANDVRTKRAGLKRDIDTGRRLASDVLQNPPREGETMRVFDFLVSIHSVGRVKANKWLAQAQISPSKTLGGMSTRQRRALYECVCADERRRLARQGKSAFA